MINVFARLEYSFTLWRWQSHFLGNQSYFSKLTIRPYSARHTNDFHVRNIYDFIWRSYTEIIYIIQNKLLVTSPGIRRDSSEARSRTTVFCACPHNNSVFDCQKLILAAKMQFMNNTHDMINLSTRFILSKYDKI